MPALTSFSKEAIAEMLIDKLRKSDARSEAAADCVWAVHRMLGDPQPDCSTARESLEAAYRILTGLEMPPQSPAYLRAQENV